MPARASLCVLVAVAALLVAACGKTAVATPFEGMYHLAGPGPSTNLELRADGTFTLRRDACDSAGALECGRWETETTTGGVRVVPREGIYWPTPETFPSAVLRGVALRHQGSGLEVTGASAWAGSFTQRWERGRSCQRCPADADTSRCAAPLPACAWR
jgi:hypothetical protein